MTCSPGGQDHVHLARIGRGGDGRGERDSRPSVVLPIAETTTTRRCPWRAYVGHAPGHVLDLLGVGDRRAAVLLHDELAHETAIVHRGATGARPGDRGRVALARISPAHQPCRARDCSGPGGCRTPRAVGRSGSRGRRRCVEPALAAQLLPRALRARPASCCRHRSRLRSRRSRCSGVSALVALESLLDLLLPRRAAGAGSARRRRSSSRLRSSGSSFQRWKSCMIRARSAGGICWKRWRFCRAAAPLLGARGSASGGSSRARARAARASSAPALQVLPHRACSSGREPLQALDRRVRSRAGGGGGACPAGAGRERAPRARPRPGHARAASSCHFTSFGAGGVVGTRLRELGGARFRRRSSIAEALEERHPPGISDRADRRGCVRRSGSEEPRVTAPADRRSVSGSSAPERAGRAEPASPAGNAPPQHLGASAPLGGSRPAQRRSPSAADGGESHVVRTPRSSALARLDAAVQPADHVEVLEQVEALDDVELRDQVEPAREHRVVHDAVASPLRTRGCPGIADVDHERDEPGGEPGRHRPQAPSSARARPAGAPARRACSRSSAR